VFYLVHEKLSRRFIEFVNIYRASGEETPPETSVHSSMRFDEPNDEDEFVMVSKTDADVHIHINSMPNGMDVSDYPQNPYGQRDVKNNSLFFEDGERSVDFVLVWKKLMPRDNDDRSETLRQKEISEVNEKENARTERRDVFEEHLIIEGLQIERVVVDDEINFIKLHAPLEVLRRYAEILKLRLPMKEVSHK
jgi:Dimerisation domain of Ca+-activated chloride-channel, anoctamin